MQSFYMKLLDNAISPCYNGSIGKITRKETYETKRKYQKQPRSVAIRLAHRDNLCDRRVR